MAKTNATDNLSLSTAGIVLYSGTTSGTFSVSNLGNGQLLIGAGAGIMPVQAALTAGAGISIVNGAGTITITNTGATGATSFTTDSGVAAPAAGNVNVFGANGIRITGAGSTVTVGFNGGGSFVTNGLLYWDGTKFVTEPALTNGQVLIGSTGNPAVPASLTAGSGISIVPGAGTITITATGASGATSFGTDVAGPVFPTGGGLITFTGINGLQTDGSVVNTVRVGLAGGKLSVANGGTNATSFTANRLILSDGAGTTLISMPVAGTTGQVLLGVTGSAPVFGSITAGILPGSVATSYTTNNNSPAIPSANILQIKGDGTVITTDGSSGGNLLTISITGLVPVSKGGTGVSSFTTNGVIYASSPTTLGSTAVGTASQVLIGTGGAPVFGTVPATALPGTVATSYTANSGSAVPSANVLQILGSSGITTSGAGNVITISSSGGGGIPWTVVTVAGPTLMAVNNGYIADSSGVALVTLTLPTTLSTAGDIIRVAGTGTNAAGGWRIAQNASDIIRFGNVTTTAGGSGRLDSTDRNDVVELLFVGVFAGSRTWTVLSSIGNIQVT